MTEGRGQNTDDRGVHNLECGTKFIDWKCLDHYFSQLLNIILNC